MKYLEYLKDGVLKTYDLDFKSGKIVLGRSSSCNISINSPYISKKHLEISLCGENIILVHISEKNPLIIDNNETESAIIKINDKFKIANVDFTIKEKKDERMIYNISSNGKNDSSDSHEVDTKTNRNKFDSNKLFSYDIQNKNDDPGYIFLTGTKTIKTIFKRGCFLVIRASEDKNELITELKMNEPMHLIHSKIELSKLIEIKKRSFSIKKHIFFPFKLIDNKTEKLFLLYYREGKEKLDDLKRDFINDFIVEFQSIYKDFAKRKISQIKNTLPIITNNEDLLGKLQQLKNIAGSNLKILIEGETGVGKELVSRFIFNNFGTNTKKYIAINCSTLPEKLIEAELFGYEKGAFTDAKSQKIGKIEESDSGTLVLDEVGELPLEAQAKLLRALQERIINRIGSNRDIKVDFNLISMTNRDLKKMVKEGNFREDLYFRIAEFSTNISPLRERREDIYPLIKYFIEKYAKGRIGYSLSFTENAVKLLEGHNWSGNVRELENMIKILISISDSGELITETSLKKTFENKFVHLKENKNINKEYLFEVLKNHFWNKTKTAKYLKISRTELYRKLKKFNIDVN